MTKDSVELHLPLSESQCRVVAEERELLLQAADTKGQVTRRQDEQDNARGQKSDLHQQLAFQMEIEDQNTVSTRDSLETN